jgi:YidC/Oxa1 family membrane protein insertase
MGFDRNTIIGFVLIGVLLVGMMWYNGRNEQAYKAEQKRIADSLERIKPKADPAIAKADSLMADSAKKFQSAGNFQRFLGGAEQLTALENNLVKITFSNKGGQPKMVELKGYKTYDGKPVVLANQDKISYTFNSGSNQTAQSADLFFEAGKPETAPDGSQRIRFAITDSAGKTIAHQYTLRPDGYMLDWDLALDGADQLVAQQTLNLQWQTTAFQAERDLKYERQQTNVCYQEKGKYDFEYPSPDDTKLESADWVGMKQQFFVNVLAAKSKFQTAEVVWKAPSDDSATRELLTATSQCKLGLPAGNKATVSLQRYYGPSDYHTLNKYGNGMEQIVPYGSGPFAFVKYINRHFLLPIWDFLRKNIGSYGMVILLLTLIIRLLTSPILYKSYLSGAKMKVLKPEVDALREKYKDDQQAFSMEQMKLWKSAGVSPMGGCLPALLQIPIFMSLYYFFQANISLRGESFLWAKDLASYDSIATLPFNIPFYGDHVSLFTLTATVTSLLISLYGMSNMQDNSNPVMKYMPYIFPVLLLGVFNSLPAALTWYYTVSNVITLILQFVIQKYIINHEKVTAQIAENRKKPVKVSAWQQRLEDMKEKNKSLMDSQQQRNKDRAASGSNSQKPKGKKK